MKDSGWLLQTMAGIIGGLSLIVPAALWLNPNSVGFVPSDPSMGSVSTATVEAVVDGDTMQVFIGGRSERVRLIGIDTPESVSTSTPNQCFGEEAALALKGLVSPGDTVKVLADAEKRDRYGRLLLYVHTADGLFINQWLVASGFADVLFYEPNTTLRPELTEVRNQARKASAGLWGQCDGPDQPLN